MAGVVLGYLKYVLGFDSLAFEKGLGDADKRLKAAQKSLQKTADKFKSIGTTLSLGITAPFTALVATSIPAAKESAEALGQVQSALTSMGDAAQRTLPQLQAQAATLMHLSTFDDDDIMRRVTANLLTFGKVSGPIFDRAQLAAVNLSARLGQDLQSSAIQLGKALNDPIKGITALSRVGVSFTAEQKAQIAAMAQAGNIAGAQGIILGELERQYGGAAEALRKATPGIEAKQAWDDFQETIGALALKVLPPLSKALAGMLDWFNKLDPSVQTFVLAAAAVAATVGPLVTVIGGAISVFGALLPAITAVGTALVAFGGFVTATAIPAIGAMLVALSPILIPLAAVAAAVGAVYLAWRNWDKIEPILKSVVIWVATLNDRIREYLVTKLDQVWKWVWGKIQWVGDKFKWLWDVVVGHSYIPDMVDAIGDHMARLQDNMVKPARWATQMTAKAFADLEAKVGPIYDRLFPEVARTDDFQKQLKDLQDDVTRPADTKAEAIRRLYAEYGRGILPEAIGAGSGALGGGIGAGISAGNDAGDAVNATMEAFERNRERMAHFFGDTLANGFRAALDGDFKGWFGNWWKDTLSRNLQNLFDQIGEKLVALLNGSSGSSSGGLLGAITALGSALGSKQGLSSAGASLGSLAGARAMGGPVSAGRTYLVGERGPELFTARRSGYVHANRHGSSSAASPTSIEVVPSPYFNVVVDGRAAGVAGGLYATSAKSSARRNRWSL